VSTRLKNRIAKIEAEKGLDSQPIIVVVNFGSDCEDDWAKAQVDAKKNQVLVPGEKERLTMAERSETGLPLLEKMWLGICELGY